MLLILLGCDQGVMDRPEKTVAAAFAALRVGDWERYRATTITMADYMLDANQVNQFKAKDSFAGGVLKPNQVRALKQQFELVTTGQLDSLDFKGVVFAGLGKELERGTYDALTGGKVPYVVYAVRLKDDATDGYEQTKPPYFAVVKWRDQYRVAALVF